MHERAGTRPGISLLCLFALVTLAGAIFLNTARYIGLLTNTPKFDRPAITAEAHLRLTRARLTWWRVQR